MRPDTSCSTMPCSALPMTRQSDNVRPFTLSAMSRAPLSIGFASPSSVSIRGILNRDERAPAGVAEHRLAGDALDLGSRFQFELAAHVVAGRQKERRAGLCGLISGVLQSCGLVAGPRHDAIGAERLRDI